MTRFTTIFAALALASLSACGGGSGAPGQDFGAPLAGLNATAPSQARSVPGLQLDYNGGWEWFNEGNYDEHYPSYGTPALARFRSTDSEGRVRVTPSMYLPSADDEDAQPLEGAEGVVVYEGAVDLSGNPTRFPAALGTTCVDGGCDYWQSDDVRLTADFGSSQATLNISEIENRSGDPKYMPDGGAIEYSGRIEGSRIVHDRTPQQGRLSGHLFEDRALGTFMTFDEYPDESPRGDVAKDHMGNFSIGRSGQN